MASPWRLWRQWPGIFPDPVPEAQFLWSLKEKQSVLLEEVSFFACSSHVCRNVRLGSLVEHCSIVCCLFGHVLLIAIDLIFLQKPAQTFHRVAEPSRAFHRVAEPSRAFHRVAEPSKTFHCVAEPSQPFQRSSARIFQSWKERDRDGSSEAVQAAWVYCKLKLYFCMFILISVASLLRVLQLLIRLFTLALSVPVLFAFCWAWTFLVGDYFALVFLVF